MIKQTADSTNGDYQLNFAMPLSKLLKIDSKVVATNFKDFVATLKQINYTAPHEEAVAQLQLGMWLAGNEIFHSFELLPVAEKGPGFLNLRLKDAWLAAKLREVAVDSRLGVPAVASPRKFIVEYSSPNVAKPLHVGHLRSTIIGDALTRLLRFQGHTVITDNHLGDWGTQFGILIHGFRNYLDAKGYDEDPVRELARLYIHVRGLFVKKSDEDEADGPTDDPVLLACQRETAKLHAGDPENVELWKKFMPFCLEAIHRIYRRLGVLPFDHEHGESFYNPLMPGVVEELLAKKLAAESKGAIVIPNAKGVIPATEEEQKKEDPPALIRKRDGAFTYTTSDLATVKYRMETFHPDAMLYAVDFRQALHFKTFFALARRWGYENVEMQHISFGSVMGENNKPFASRSGGVPELMDLIDEAVVRGLAKYKVSYTDRKAHGHDVPDLTPETEHDIAEAIGVGAIKYADLSQNRTSNYVFSYDKMLATEGNCSTYMQYAYARCRSIFRKGNIDETRFRTDPPAVVLHTAQERAIALQLLRFPEAVDAAGAEYFPHLLSAYLWDLCKAMSRFYDECPVLTAETPELRDSRLLIVDLVSRVIRQTLDLLGIRTVERM
mgnify:CR=1 FL=1